MSVSSIENSMLSKLATEWGNRASINWSNCNAPFDTSDPLTGYTYNKSYLVPSIQQLAGDYLETPVASSVRQFDYLFYLNVLAFPDIGIAEVQGHVERLREIFELKTFIFGDSQCDCGLVQSRSGFTTDRGDLWETPVFVSFTAIL